MNKIMDVCTFGKKSQIKASEALSEGKYQFFSSSTDVTKRFDKYQFSEEGLIMGTGGNATLHYCPGYFSVSTDCVVLLCDKTIILPKYLYYYLLQHFHLLEEGFKGAGLKHTNKQYIGSIPISYIPSIDDQKQIIKMIDKVQSIILNYQQLIEALDTLIKSRFVEMFGNPVTNTKQWETRLLGECLLSIDNGKSYVCSDSAREGNNPGILKLSAATYGEYRPNENKALLDHRQFVSEAEIKPGDLLFTRKNTPELVGMAAYVYNTPPNLMMPDLIFRLNTNSLMSPLFLWQLIKRNHFLEE